MVLTATKPFGRDGETRQLYDPKCLLLLQRRYVRSPLLIYNTFFL